MATKVAIYAERAGVNAVGVGPIVLAYQLAVDTRLEVLRDVFHPELLHPARSVLILLEDANCTDVATLTAAALTETEFPEMRVPLERIRVSCGQDVAALVAAAPQPVKPPEELLEELVGLRDDVALIAVAERLDHARHLHFRNEKLWPAFFEQIRDVYLPFSGRVNPVLQTRLARWAGAFGNRLKNPT